jgi:hypothetical protein
VPLSPDHDEEERAPASSSTTFFALPAPVRRKDAEPAPAARPEPVASGPVGPPPGTPPAGYVPAGAVPPGYTAPGYTAPGYTAPGYAPVSMAPIGIQGPIASGYPGMPVAASLPPDTSRDTERARSFRVAAVVIGLGFMVCTVTVVAVVLLVTVAVLPGQVANKDQTQIVAPIATPPPRRPVPAEDTGVPPKPIEKPAPVRPKPSGGGSTEPRPKPAPAPPPSSPAAVTVTLAPGSPPFTAFEVVCSNASFRQRAQFSNGTATLAGVPRDDCKLFFKGGPPISTKVTGGQTLNCSFVGTAANCN